MRLRAGRLAALAVLSLCCCALAEALGPIPKLGGYDIGLIFNTNDLLLDFESYQGGLGVKLSGEELAYRLLLDLFGSTESHAFSLSLGGAVERHWGSARVQPYVGGYLTFGFGSSDAAGTKSVSLPVTAGGLFGVEIYIFRFLSLFGEYDLSLTMKYSKTETSTAGVETTDQSTDWTLQLGSGNQSKIGIVFYFQQGRDLRLEPIANSRW